MPRGRKKKTGARRSKRARTHRRRIRVVGSVMAVCTLGGGGWALAHSRVFGVSDIEVLGAPKTSRADVIRVSGVHLGESALSVDLVRAAARVRELPWVATARVQHSGALGIRIVVTVRRAAAEIHSPNGIWYVDRDGRRIEAALHDALPTIVIPTDRALADAGSSVAEAVEAALKLWERLPADLHPKVRSIAPQLDGELHFDLGAIAVSFGTIDRVDAKLRAIELVMQRVASEGRELRSIDVASPEHPAARVA